ncbi:MAG TPA: hypothetical protein VHS07_02720 [Candidatus Binataceae bacterium]|nr:hypothetical protein [Candidatus Binataceae bacterium]
MSTDQSADLLAALFSELDLLGDPAALESVEVLLLLDSDDDVDSGLLAESVLAASVFGVSAFVESDFAESALLASTLEVSPLDFA